MSCYCRRHAIVSSCCHVCLHCFSLPCSIPCSSPGCSFHFSCFLPTHTWSQVSVVVHCHTTANCLSLLSCFLPGGLSMPHTRSCRSHVSSYTSRRHAFCFSLVCSSYNCSLVSRFTALMLSLFGFSEYRCCFSFCCCLFTAHYVSYCWSHHQQVTVIAFLSLLTNTLPTPSLSRHRHYHTSSHCHTPATACLASQPPLPPSLEG